MIKPNICVVAINETEGWSDDIKKKVEKIETVYLYDKNLVFHLCEITPSSELHPLYYVPHFLPEYEEDDEIRDDIENEVVHQDITYLSTSFADGVTRRVEHGELLDLDEEELIAVCDRSSEAYRQYIDACIEYCQGNHDF